MISMHARYVTRYKKYPVTILHINLKNSDHPVVGIIHHGNNDVVMQWTSVGRWKGNDPEDTHPLDLVQVFGGWGPGGNPGGSGGRLSLDSEERKAA